MLTLRADLTDTQVGVSGASGQAQEALLVIVASFRTEAETMRQQTSFEAQQSVARLEQVVAQARAKFDEQDSRFTAGLQELGQRLQAADAWAQAEPARLAAAVQSAPPPWLSAPLPATPPGERSDMSPGRLGLGPALPNSPGWGARQQQLGPLGGLGPMGGLGLPPTQHQQRPPQQDPWAQFLATGGAAQDTPAAPRHYDIASPSGFVGGKGGGLAAGAASAAKVVSPRSCASTRATGETTRSSTWPRASTASRSGAIEP